MLRDFPLGLPAQKWQEHHLYITISKDFTGHSTQLTPPTENLGGTQANSSTGFST